MSVLVLSHAKRAKGQRINVSSFVSFKSYPIIYSIIFIDFETAAKNGRNVMMIAKAWKPTINPINEEWGVTVSKCAFDLYRQTSLDRFLRILQIFLPIL